MMALGILVTSRKLGSRQMRSNVTPINPAIYNRINYYRLPHASDPRLVEMFHSSLRNVLTLDHPSIDKDTCAISYSTWKRNSR